jgi:hypothetical protein
MKDEKLTKTEEEVKITIVSYNFNEFTDNKLETVQHNPYE